MFVLDNTWLTYVLLIGLSLTTLSFVAGLVLLYFASTEYYTLIGKRHELTEDQREFERVLMESTTAMMNGDRPMNLEIIELNAQYITRKH